MLKSNEEINIFLAEYIREKREEKKISQRELGRRSGLSSSKISAIEGCQGFEKRHSIHVVAKICYAMDLDINELWKGFFI